MIHLIRYDFKKLFRSKEYLLWGILFPVAYISFFILALGGIISEDGIKLDTIQVAIVENEAEDTAPISLSEFFDEVNKRNENEKKPFLEYQLTDSDQAQKLLEDEKIHAIIKNGSQSEMITSPKNSLYPTIIRQILQSYQSIKEARLVMTEAIQQGKIPIPQNLIEQNQSNESDSNESKGFFTGSNFRGLNTDQQKKGIPPDRIYFFSLLAYIAFYPISAGSEIVENTEANQNNETMRKRLGPVPKSKIFISSLFPVVLFQITLIILIYLYTQLLRVDYGPWHGANILLLVLGTLAALFTGTTLAAYNAKNKGFRIAISVALPLLLAFLNGMMVSRVYEILKEKFPVFFDLMPVGMVSQGLYILNLEGIGPKYWQKISYLLIYIVLLFVLTLIGIRRSRYESI